MIGYVYIKKNKIITGIIENVTSIYNDSLIGDKMVIPINGKFDYIILENSINKNMGDVIDITGLEDLRYEFLPETEKLKRDLELSNQKIKKQNEEIESQKYTTGILTDYVVDLQFQLDMNSI